MKKDPGLRDLSAANARIVELEAKVARLDADCGRLMREASEAVRRAEVAGIYVRACLAIREAPYPSEDFKEAVGHASACYRALVEAFTESV